MYHAQESHMQQTDIFIVDGGIAGTATAYYLALSGHQVTLLEQSELAGDCTGYLGHLFRTILCEEKGDQDGTEHS